MIDAKTIALMLIALLAVSAIPFAAAQGAEEGAGNTDEELGSFVSPLGAEVRLLQLEKSLTANILRGEEILQYIQDNYPDADTAELESILDEMSLLLEEVQDAPTEGVANELALAYADLKKDATELTGEFRKLAADIISPGERDQLRAELKAMEQNRLSELDEAIKQARREYNAEQAAQMLMAMGIEDEELLEDIAAGTATQAQIREAVKQAVSGMDSGQRKDAMLKLKEAVSKRFVFRMAAAEAAIEGSFERQVERLEKRSQAMLAKSSEAAENGLTIRAMILERLSQRTEARAEGLSQTAEQIREKIQQMVQNNIQNAIQYKYYAYEQTQHQGDEGGAGDSSGEQAQTQNNGLVIEVHMGNQIEYGPGTGEQVQTQTQIEEQAQNQGSDSQIQTQNQIQNQIGEGESSAGEGSAEGGNSDGQSANGDNGSGSGSSGGNGGN